MCVKTRPATFFLKICSHIFMILSDWSNDFDHPKQEMDQQSKWFCGLKFFCSNVKVDWESSVCSKIRFLVSGFFVQLRQFHFGFYCSFQFFGSDFF